MHPLTLTIAMLRARRLTVGCSAGERRCRKARQAGVSAMHAATAATSTVHRQTCGSDMCVGRGVHHPVAGVCRMLQEPLPQWLVLGHSS